MEVRVAGIFHHVVDLHLLVDQFFLTDTFETERTQIFQFRTVDQEKQRIVFVCGSQLLCFFQFGKRIVEKFPFEKDTGFCDIIEDSRLYVLFLPQLDKAIQQYLIKMFSRHLKAFFIHFAAKLLVYLFGGETFTGQVI